MKKVILIVIILTCTGKGMAQEKINSLELNWGIGHLKRQDVNLSPFILNPTSALNLGISYEHNGKFYHRVYSRFGRYTDYVGEMYEYSVDWSGDWEVVELWPHSFNIVDLNYTFGYKLRSDDKFSVFIGGQSRNLLNLGAYDHGNHAISYYNLSFAFDAWAGLNLKLSDKQTIGAEFSLPLITWVTKSPYLGQDDEYFYNVKELNVIKIVGNYIKDGHLESWDQSQRIDMQFNYAYQLNNKWGLNARYALSLNSYRSPASYMSIENILFIGAELKF